MIELTTLVRRLRRPSTRTVTFGLIALALTVGFAGGRSTLAASGQLAATTQPARTAEVVPQTAVVSYSGIVDRVAPAIVTIRVEKPIAATSTAVPDSLRDFFGPEPRNDPRERRESGLGSGVIIRADGYILTNHHVVTEASRMRVELADGRSFTAKLVGSDAASDLAVLHIEARDLPTVPFGDSDRVKVGDQVLAFGNPLGVGQAVTMGIVSAKGRATGFGDGDYEDFLQTDAPINQGNSGGALVNMQGELVGINAQILSPSGGNIGLGFAIPSSMAQAVTEQLARDGLVHRSKLGVMVQSMTPELAETLGLRGTRGALVSAVDAGSPAEHAGLQQGDVITEIDGRAVADGNALRNQIASTRPGTEVSMTVVRGGRTESLSARVTEREREGAGSSRPEGDGDRGESSLGMALTPVTPSVAGQLDLPRSEPGLAVTDVDPAGVAASAGIRAGDVITRVNGREVRSIPALRAALDARTDKPALVLLNRQGASLFVALPHARS